jgi:hypothetical protein
MRFHGEIWEIGCGSQNLRYLRQSKAQVIRGFCSCLAMPCRPPRIPMGCLNPHGKKKRPGCNPLVISQMSPKDVPRKSVKRSAASENGTLPAFPACHVGFPLDTRLHEFDPIHCGRNIHAARPCQPSYIQNASAHILPCFSSANHNASLAISLLGN